MKYKDEKHKIQKYKDTKTQNTMMQDCEVGGQAKTALVC